MEATAFTTAPCHAVGHSTMLPPPVTVARPSRVFLARAQRRVVIPSMASEVNIAKKAAKVDKVKERLAQSQLLVSVPLDGITVSQLSSLKKSLPSGTSVMTIKNTLMRRAVTDSLVWSSTTDLLKNSSLWIFVKDDDMKDSLKAYKDFLKATAREAPICGGVYEGTCYDENGIEAIAALPNKKELITKIAIAIKAVPTKIGRSINAVPTKVGRVVKLAFAEEDSDAPDS